MGESQEEPTLPPHRSGDERPSSFTKRKRSIASHLFSDSSDVPLFSSDDDPAVENYVEGRRVKKQYAGPWFKQHQSASGPSESRAKRTFERQVDSGVFMGSDTSIDDILDHIPPPPASRLPEINQAPTQAPRSSQTVLPPPIEAEAMRRIQHCIDHGTETVDLSNMQLEHISNNTISLLSEFVPIPNVEKDVPFENKDPSLKLFLFRNRLTRVPGALFSLDHLTVLSLRGNLLTELPPSIMQLTNLRELNVSQNCLKHVPMELIELLYDDRCSLKSLTLHPNPWYQPRPETEEPELEPVPLKPRPAELSPENSGNDWLSISSESKDKRGECLYAYFRARTPVQVMDTLGLTYTDFRIDPNEAHLSTEAWDSEPAWPEEHNPPSSGKVLSLMELALQSCSRSPYLSKMPEILDQKEHGHLIGLLNTTYEQHETGGLRCTVCKRPVIKPAAQWIEWWQVFQSRQDTSDPRALPGGPDEGIPTRKEEPLTKNPNEKLTPFLRRACSWKCVLDPVRGLGQRREKMDGEVGNHMTS